jgi:glycosyltransferase involved in cell wall biosynthesis
MDPLSNVFVQHHVKALRASGVKVGVLVTPLLHDLGRAASALSHGVGLKSEPDGDVPVLRFHGIHLLPCRVRRAGVELAEISHWGEAAYRTYVRAHGEPDLLHAHNVCWGGALGVRIKRRYGPPLVVTEHSSGFVRLDCRTDRRELLAKAYERADAVVAVSQMLGRRLEELFGSAVKGWHLVPDVLDSLFEGAPLGASSANDGRFRFLSIANLLPWKRHTLLLRSFARAFGHEDTVELDVGGSGPLLRPLQELARELDIAARVHFLGRLGRRAVLGAMGRCGAFVLSSSVETFGVVLIEALSRGKPVVATDSGGPRDIVTTANGLITSCDDVDALAEAMRSVRRHYQDYDPVAIRRDCVARFGREAFVRRITSIYADASREA